MKSLLMNNKLTLAIALLFAPLAALRAADAPSRIPKIVFIDADDWGWGDLSWS